MINQKLKDICNWAVSFATKNGCKQCKATIATGYEKCVEIRNGELDQMNHASSCLLTIHLYVDGRFSVVTTNRLEKAELEQFISKSIANTRHLAEDIHRYLPDNKLYYTDKQFIDLQNYDHQYTQVSIEEKLAVAHMAYNEMNTNNEAFIAGTAMVDDYEGSAYTVSSNGFSAESHDSSFALSCTTSVRGEGDDRPEGYHYDFSPFWRSLPKSGIGTKSLQRAIKKIGAKKIPTGSYSMIVENRVASQLLSPIINALKGDAIQQQQSFLLDKKGEKLFADIFTLIDNPHEIGNAGAALFDSDGIALKQRTIIDNGTVNEYYIGQYISRKLECEASTPSPCVLKFAKHTDDLNNIINKLQKAILVTGFNGGNCNGTTGDFSYGIEGYLIENGIITSPFSEMIITGNMISLWQNLSDIASDTRQNSSWMLPSICFNDVLIS